MGKRWEKQRGRAIKEEKREVESGRGKVSTVTLEKEGEKKKTRAQEVEYKSK